MSTEANVLKAARPSIVTGLLVVAFSRRNAE